MLFRSGPPPRAGCLPAPSAGSLHAAAGHHPPRRGPPPSPACDCGSGARRERPARHGGSPAEQARRRAAVVAGGGAPCLPRPPEVEDLLPCSSVLRRTAPAKESCPAREEARRNGPRRVPRHVCCTERLHRALGMESRGPLSNLARVLQYAAALFSLKSNSKTHREWVGVPTAGSLKTTKILHLR